MIYVICGAIALIVSVAGVFLFNAVKARLARRPQKGKPSAGAKKPSLKKGIEFSKVVLGLVMFTYFAGFFYGLYAVNRILLDYPDYAVQALIALFSHVGVPIGVAIGFYSWKAKCENVLKFKKENKKETEGITFDPGNIV